jgi:hypothetical protein
MPNCNMTNRSAARLDLQRRHRRGEFGGVGDTAGTGRAQGNNRTPRPQTGKAFDPRFQDRKKDARGLNLNR